eukprot:TRINITY_DN1002_c1_g1_i1.p1 TRINITY_DN1002_c1_g1~~TRINITY_DN1002_c1_g1_i1.p1  ORF type:complete len:876 (-),score=128.45 TRINITY_DN1002_c1_g1_i1:1309-3807(-)
MRIMSSPPQGVRYMSSYGGLPSSRSMSRLRPPLGPPLLEVPGSECEDSTITIPPNGSAVPRNTAPVRQNLSDESIESCSAEQLPVSVAPEGDKEVMLDKKIKVVDFRRGGRWRGGGGGDGGNVGKKGKGKGTDLSEWVVPLMIFSLLCIGAMIATFVFCINYVENHREESVGKFFHISDIHLDPLFRSGATTASDCRGALEQAEQPFGTYGCDSPLLLLRSALEEMARVASAPDFILVTGDMSSFNLSSTNSTLRMLMQVDLEIQTAFPDPATKLLYVLGESEVPREWRTASMANSIWLTQLATAWNDSLSNAGPDAHATFCKGGYYTAIVEANDVRGQLSNVAVIVLNTVLYSVEVGEDPPSDDEDPAGQLKWLEKELQQARHWGRKVIIAGHKPPGVRATGEGALWHGGFEMRFTQIIVANADVIIGQLFGALHRGHFRLIRKDDPLSSPSLSTNQLLTTHRLVQSEDGTRTSSSSPQGTSRQSTNQISTELSTHLPTQLIRQRNLGNTYEPHNPILLAQSQQSKPESALEDQPHDNSLLLPSSQSSLSLPSLHDDTRRRSLLSETHLGSAPSVPDNWPVDDDSDVLPEWDVLPASQASRRERWRGTGKFFDPKSSSSSSSTDRSTASDSPIGLLLSRWQAVYGSSRSSATSSSSRSGSGVGRTATSNSNRPLSHHTSASLPPLAASTLLMVPSLSPRLENRPAFRLFRYNRWDLLLDYTEYSADLNSQRAYPPQVTWSAQYGARSLYGLHALDASDWAELAGAFFNTTGQPTKVFLEYCALRGAGRSLDVGIMPWVTDECCEKCPHHVHCSVEYGTYAQYQACQKRVLP